MTVSAAMRWGHAPRRDAAGDTHPPAGENDTHD